jgi:hypothetical protein
MNTTWLLGDDDDYFFVLAETTTSPPLHLVTWTPDDDVFYLFLQKQKIRSLGHFLYYQMF